MVRLIRCAILTLMVGFIASGSALASTTQAQAPWPGQSGNAVGYAAWSGWTGSFSSTPCPSSPASGTGWSSATVVQNCTYSSATTIRCNYCEFIQVDFNAGTSATQVNGSHILFLADRFQSNDVQASNIGVTGSDIYFFYDSVEPLLSVAISPPGFLWPSAGAGTNSNSMVGGTNTINSGYEFGFNIGSGSGPIWIDHCDIWGFGDAIVIQTTTAKMTITNNHMHDTANPSGTGYHLDGPGYSNGGLAPNNVWIIGNTVAMLGNTNALALQAATGGYQNIYVNGNFFSGDNATISFCHPGSVQCTNSTFYGNVFGTDVKDDGAVYDPGAPVGSGTVWACNTIAVRPGTTWTNLDGWTPTSAMNGQFFINAFPPNSTTDTGGNTSCGMPAPSSINFGNQGINTSSAGQTIVFSNTNSATLSISSITLATGSQFSISSNTCGSTLNSGSSCSIAVKFSPTSVGPQTDTLRITDSTPGVSSPQLVPLAGIGSGSSSASAPAPPTGLIAVVQ
jgi:hypothetical protein